ncbi:unnamed protein product [Lasius platythorax]|uniref:Uncharacterized protein n=1 Tax=Lasius platythorax TaxID=488582 RepID=A0AAV2N5F2_9HYME
MVIALVAFTAAERALQTSWKEERYQQRRRKRVAPGGEGEAEGVARTEAKGERRREGAEGLGSPGGVGGSSNQDDSGYRGDERGRRWGRRGWEGTGTGTRERRNTNRLDVDGGVGVGPDMAEASRLPEVAKEMKCLPAGEAALPSLPLPPPPREFLPSPSHRNRRSSPGFPEFSSFQGM